MVEGDQIYGDGVNVAARLESIVEPGGICISESVYGQIRKKLVLVYEDIGAQRVKNITEPVRVWRIRLDRTAAPRQKPAACANVSSRRVVVDGIGDRRGDDCTCNARFAPTATNVCIGTISGTLRSRPTEQAVDCGSAIRQPQR